MPDATRLNFTASGVPYSIGERRFSSADMPRSPEVGGVACASGLRAQGLVNGVPGRVASLMACSWGDAGVLEVLVRVRLGGQRGYMLVCAPWRGSLRRVP